MKKIIILLISLSCLSLFIGLSILIFSNKQSNKERFIMKSITYKVQTGDNIKTIAEKFNLTYRELLFANNMKSIDDKIGVNLIIPNQIIVNLTKDDTINKLSNKFHIDSSKLKLANDMLGNDDKINNKKTFIIPNRKFHIVKKGENLDFISKKYNVTKYILKEVNEIKGNIQKDDFIVIPNSKEIYDMTPITLQENIRKNYKTPEDEKRLLKVVNLATTIYNSGTYKKYNYKNGTYNLTLGNLKEMKLDVNNNFNLCLDSDVVMTFYEKNLGNLVSPPFIVKDKCIE